MEVTKTVLALIQVWKNNQFDNNWNGKAVLADALEDAGCEDKDLLKDLRAWKCGRDPAIKCENLIVDPRLRDIDIGYMRITYKNTEWKVRRSDFQVLWAEMPYYLVRVMPLSCLLYFLWNPGGSPKQVMATKNPIDILNLKPPPPPTITKLIYAKV